MITSLMVIAAAVFAGNHKPVITDNSSRTWSLDEKFTSIVAKGNVELVLVTDNSNTVNISGVEKHVNELHLKIENGVLTITGRKTFTRNKTVVYVPVRELEKVTLKGNANLSSKGRIESKQLHIRVEGTSTVNVKSSGDVLIDSDELHDFNYQKSEKSILRIEKA